MEPYPTNWASASHLICFDEVPLDTRQWKPLTAPQAMVMKRKGKIQGAPSGLSRSVGFAGGGSGAPEDSRHEQPDEDQAEGAQQLQAVDVIPRLEQGPDRQDRGHVAVDQQNDDPGDGGPFFQGLIESSEHSHVAEVDGEIHDCQGDERWKEQVDAAAVKRGANGDGQGNLDQAGKNR